MTDWIFCKNKDKDFKGEAPKCPNATPENKELLEIIRNQNGVDAAKAISDWLANNRPLYEYYYDDNKYPDTMKKSKPHDYTYNPIRKISKELETIIDDYIQDIAETHNVSVRAARWWVEKNMALDMYWEDGELMGRMRFKTPGELLYDVDVPTEYDREMEREIMQSTVGKVKFD